MTLFAVPEPKRAEAPRLTERAMLDLLTERYTQDRGNGPRYVFAEHVKSSGGFDAERIADFIGMHLWPSDRFELHGHEVKVSRSDWLTELRDPSKADAFKRYMDRWWLVAADRSLVRDDLPDGWGLMVPAGARLRVVVPAPKLAPEPMPRGMLASLLRAVAKTNTRRSA